MRCPSPRAVLCTLGEAIQGLFYVIIIFFKVLSSDTTTMSLFLSFLLAYLLEGEYNCAALSLCSPKVEDLTVWIWVR